MQEYTSSNPSGTTYTPPYIGNVDISGGSTPYVMPRQTGTGATRGTQTITGNVNVADPATNTVNISISGPNGYQLFTNTTTGNANIIIGKLPDGTYGMVTTPPDVDVLSVFS